MVPSSKLPLTAIAAVAVLVIVQSVALADNLRAYSTGGDLSNSGSLTGVYSSHAYAEITAPATSTNCDQPLNIYANAVYRSQWVYYDNNNQIEYGIAENCGGQPGEWLYRYAIWLTGGQVVWLLNPNQITLAGPDPNGHSFQEYRVNGLWYFVHDNLDEGSYLSSNLAGNETVAGIESNNYSTVVPNHWFSNLQSTANEGPWHYWGAAPNQRVDTNFCGSFRSPTQWGGAENSACN